MLLEALQEVGQLEIGYLRGADVPTTCLDQALGQVLFEALQVHDLVFDGVAHDESEDIDCAGLADTVGSVHGLQVIHRVPVMLHEDHDICTCQS